MKKILLSTFLLGSILSFAAAQYLHFDYETESVSPTNMIGSLWQGVVLNPLKDAVNGSDSVGYATTNTNAGSGVIHLLTSPLNLTEDNYLSLKVYNATLSGEIRLRFGYTGGPTLEIDQQYTTPGAWAELTWTIPKEYDGEYSDVFIICGHDRSDAGEQWYIDDLEGAPLHLATGPGGYFSTVDFRKDWSGFQGASYGGIVANPSASGLNQNPYAGKFLTGSAGWSGIAYTLAGPVEFTEDNTHFQMKVYSDSIGVVRIQLEGGTQLKMETPYTTPGEWAHLDFDAVAAGDTSLVYTGITLIFDSKDSESGEEWYFDAVTGPMMEIGPTTPTTTYFDLEGTDNPTFHDWGSAVFGGIVDNPNPGGINTSDSVAQAYTGSVSWDGYFYDLPTTIDMSEQHTFTMDVYSDSTGYVRVQLEAGGKQLKTHVMYDTPGVWTTLTYDLTTAISGSIIDDWYTRIVFLFDDTEGDVGEEWYFDNLKGPNLTPVYYKDVTFMIEVLNSTATQYELDLNNLDDKMMLYDDGTHGDTLASDGVWTTEMMDIDVGDYTFDLYEDGTLTSVDDIEFSVMSVPGMEYITHSFNANPTVAAKFKVTVINAVGTSFEIDIDNSSEKTMLYDDASNGDETAGDGIWSADVAAMTLGAHVMDLYIDGVMKADEVTFSLAEGSEPIVVEYTYDATSIENLELKGFNVYPNPANEFVTISANAENLDNIRIYDMTGKVLKQIGSIGNTEITLDISNMNSGVYFLQIIGDEEINGFVKLLIE